jgi:hypothetical protein
VLVGLNKLPLISARLVPLAPPVTPPVTSGTGQEYVVPAGTRVLGGVLTGFTLNAFPIQIAAVWLGITGLGLMVTVTVKGLPMQLPAAPDVGVTVYVAVCTVLVVLVNALVILA